MNRQKYFAVRVVIIHEDGSSTQRDYVRGETRLGRDKFAAWALGDMLSLVTGHQRPEQGADWSGEPIQRWRVYEVTGEQVAENRRFHHTTH
jgi:hypothetical protein